MLESELPEMRRLWIFGGPMDGGSMMVPEAHLVENNICIAEDSVYLVKTKTDPLFPQGVQFRLVYQPGRKPSEHKNGS